MTHQGLTEEEAKRLLSRHGFNEIPSTQRKSLKSLLFEVIREPMVLLLLIAAGIYFSIGSASDSILLLISVLFVVGVTVYQESRSTRALEALRDLSTPKATVVRNGIHKKISSKEIVPGDVLVIKEGDRVVADCKLLENLNLELDESLLTGESYVVSKKTDDLVYSGTLVTSGHGVAIVVATGMATEIGKIGSHLSDKVDSKTVLQSEIVKLVRRFGILALLFCCFVIVTYGIKQGDWLHAFLAGIAAAMSLLPEEFPVVLTIFLALGAWRLSRRNVLVRQAAATENLGAITVLCVDKTGTLTQNEMKLNELRTLHSHFTVNENGPTEIPLELRELLSFAALACQVTPFDPMEKALLHVWSDRSSSWRLKQQYPLQPGLFAMTNAWQTESNKYVIAMKGAPEAVIALCKLNSEKINIVKPAVEAMAREGMRVLGVASATWNDRDLPLSQTDFTFQFLGLLGFVDPVRPKVKESVAECDGAGIRIVMITGDHVVTAKKIAHDISLKNPERALTGLEVEKLNDSQLAEEVKDVQIFARMIPEQKLRIVKALKSRDEVVGMTGDGVNDAPSLKWADVGIAMGGRGTDVAREAADLVVLDDDFSSIVAAIKLGRRIFDNIQSAMSFIFAAHFPIAALTLVPILMDLPLILYPAHIVFIELIIDPACTLVFEQRNKDAGLMHRPPRRIEEPLFGVQKIIFSSIQGAMAFMTILFLYILTLHFRYSEHHARTMAFLAFVFSILGLISVNLSVKEIFKNRFFGIVLAVTIIFLAIISVTPSLQKIFKIIRPSFEDIAIALGVALISTALSFAISRKKV